MAIQTDDEGANKLTNTIMLAHISQWHKCYRKSKKAATMYKSRISE